MIQNDLFMKKIAENPQLRREVARTWLQAIKQVPVEVSEEEVEVYYALVVYKLLRVLDPVKTARIEFWMLFVTPQQLIEDESLLEEFDDTPYSFDRFHLYMAYSMNRT